MPHIPKTEPASPKKASAEKPAKGGKAPGGKKASAEKAGKAKAGSKAAKGAVANGKDDKKPKKERKVFELPGQTRDTPAEVSSAPMLIVTHPCLCSVFLQVLIWITRSTSMDQLALSTISVCS